MTAPALAGALVVLLGVAVLYVGLEVLGGIVRASRRGRPAPVWQVALFLVALTAVVGSAAALVYGGATVLLGSP